MHIENNQEYIDARVNLLLSSLSETEYNRLLPHLQLVNLSFGQCLYESGEKITCVYFPLTAIVSLLYNMENGSLGESAIVGKDGVVGISLFMGGKSTTNRAVVQNSGYALKLNETSLKTEFNRCGTLQEVLLLYTMALFAQVTQTAACNKFHSVEQQLCRWLLMSLDRLPSSEILMTQEVISNILGVRRASITIAAEKLQEVNLISYHRGHIFILDREGLEQRVCECYQIVKKEVTRLFQ